MRRYLLLLLLAAIACIGGAQAYLLNIEAPSEITRGLPLVVNGSSTFPAGFGFDVVLSLSQITSQEVARKTTAVGADGKFMVVFDTTDLSGGQYKVEARLSGEDASKLGSSSNTIVIVNIIDRQNELHITSPLIQSTPDALLIEGTIDKIGNSGVELTVLGPPGTVFGPKYIATKGKPGPEDMPQEGSFSQRVFAPDAGNYYASFRDAQGYIGSATFVVNSPVPAAQAETSFPTTTLPTSVPEPTRSPAPVVSLVGGLVLACAGAGYLIGKNR